MGLIVVARWAAVRKLGGPGLGMKKSVETEAQPFSPRARLDLDS